jgi:hypothetical protein
MRSVHEEFHKYFITDENHQPPNRAGGFLRLVSGVESGFVCIKWGGHWGGKVAFHPPVQDEVKRYSGREDTQSKTERALKPCLFTII